MELMNIFKALNRALHDKDSEISLLQWRAETAEKRVSELQAQLEEATAEDYVKKDGWKPGYGDIFYYYGEDGVGYSRGRENDMHSLALIASGNCAPSLEELRAKEPEILAALGLEKWED